MRARKGKAFATTIGNAVKCPVCGKTFVPAPYHVYKEAGRAKTRKVCSYSCMLKAERKFEANKKPTGYAAHKKKK